MTTKHVSDLLETHLLDVTQLRLRAGLRHFGFMIRVAEDTGDVLSLLHDAGGEAKRHLSMSTDDDRLRHSTHPFFFHVMAMTRCAADGAARQSTISKSCPSV